MSLEDLVSRNAQAHDLQGPFDTIPTGGQILFSFMYTSISVSREFTRTMLGPKIPKRDFYEGMVRYDGDENTALQGRQMSHEPRGN